MGESRACASKWVNRYRSHGELGLEDRLSTPHHQPTATPAGHHCQAPAPRFPGIERAGPEPRRSLLGTGKTQFLSSGHVYADLGIAP